MLLLNCPNCGDRNASEFRYGGEYNPRPAEPEQASEAEWVRYLYLHTNAMDEQTEWWYHHSGCGLWFLAQRHRKSNCVTRTYEWHAGGPN